MNDGAGVNCSIPSWSRLMMVHIAVDSSVMMVLNRMGRRPRLSDTMPSLRKNLFDGPCKSNVNLSEIREGEFPKIRISFLCGLQSKPLKDITINID